jgi:hypothetical protein
MAIFSPVNRVEIFSPGSFNRAETSAQAEISVMQTFAVF